MDLTHISPELVAMGSALIGAVSALASAYIGHTAGANALSKDFADLTAKLEAGISLAKVSADLDALNKLVKDAKWVIDSAQAAPPAPPAA